jgi:hypothetical protein
VLKIWKKEIQTQVSHLDVLALQDLTSVSRCHEITNRHTLSLDVRKSGSVFEILDSHSGVVTDFSLLKYDSLCVSIYVPTFRRRLLLLSSEKYGSSKLFGNVGTESLHQSTRRRTPEDFAIFEGVRKDSKNLNATSKFEEPGGLH